MLLIDFVLLLNRVELLGFDRLTDADALAFAAIFRLLPELPINDAVLANAIKIFQQFRLKTPDAVVADTALVHGLNLAAVDAGFTRGAGLVVVNPLLGA